VLQFFSLAMEAPSFEMVCAAVMALNSNPDPGEKIKASEWLQEFQKSVYAWQVFTIYYYYLLLDSFIFVRAVP